MTLTHHLAQSQEPSRCSQLIYYGTIKKWANDLSTTHINCVWENRIFYFKNVYKSPVMQQIRWIIGRIFLKLHAKGFRSFSLDIVWEQGVSGGDGGGARGNGLEIALLIF